MSWCSGEGDQRQECSLHSLLKTLPSNVIELCLHEDLYEAYSICLALFIYSALLKQSNH